MTAATATTHADIAAKAHAVLAAALPVVRAVLNLDAALDNYTALASGVIGWEAVYPDLAASPDPDGEALEMAAAEAEECARTVRTAMTGGTS